MNKLPTVKQSNVISQSSYMMPAMARKLVFSAMARLSPDDEKGTITMTSYDVLESLGLSRGGNQYDLIKKAFKESMEQVIEINSETGWKMLHWFTSVGAVLRGNSEEYIICFHPDILPYAQELKKNFTVLNLENIGKLQGKYSIRIYELVMSFSGMAGENGNRSGSWFIQKTIEEFRHMFRVDNYPRTSNFRAWVIDKPIEEINSASIGIHITPEYIRKGKKLLAIKLKVRRVLPKEPKKVNPVTDHQKEIEKYKKLYPGKWGMLFNIRSKQKDMFFDDPQTRDSFAEEETLKDIIEWVKNTKEEIKNN